MEILNHHRLRYEWSHQSLLELTEILSGGMLVTLLVLLVVIVELRLDGFRTKNRNPSPLQ